MIPWWTLLIVIPCVCSVAVAVFAVVCGSSAYDRGYGDGHKAGWEGGFVSGCKWDTKTEVRS